MSRSSEQSNAYLMDYLYHKASRQLIPLSGTFELSPVCNFSCRMCYVRKTAKEVQESSRKILNLDDWLRIAREAREQGMLYLLLTGGEPFLWPDFWKLYDELIDMGFLISINSNGSLIDENAIKHLVSKAPRKINITLYGASDESYERLCGVKGVFTKVKQAIDQLVAVGIVVKLNCSLTPENAADLDNIIQFAKDRKLLLSVVTYMFPPVRRDPSMVGINERFTAEDAAYYRLATVKKQAGDEYYYDYLKKILDGAVEPPGLDEGCVDPLDGKIHCRAGKATFWVTWDGWMTPCGTMSEPKVDMKEMSFSQAWQLITEKSAALKLSGVCEKCPNQNICHPCAAIAYAETGVSTGIPRYLCHMVNHMQCIAKQTLRSE